MSELIMNRKFYDKLEEKEIKEVLALYGYQSRDEFLKKVVDILNTEESLGITKIVLMSKEDERIYSMYNGYVRGDFKDYDEVIVSFSDLKTKEGNTIISQQIMPMIQHKIDENKDFLHNERIKKIFMLTSHKSSILSVDKNFIKEDNRGSTINCLVKCLVTMGFEIKTIFPIKNLTTDDKYNSVKELIDDIEYLMEQNPANSQYKQIKLVGKKVIGSFSKKPLGQDEKYFAIKYLTAIMLNKNNKYDVSQALTLSNNSGMIKMLSEFAKYIQENNITLVFDENSVNNLPDTSLMQEVETDIDNFYNKITKYANKYGIQGVREVKRLERIGEIQNMQKKYLVKKYGNKCAVSNVTTDDLLVLSHIKGAAKCDIFDKANPNNAILLSVAYDKLFDRHLITFNAKNGKLVISDKLSDDEKKIYQLNEQRNLPSVWLTEERRKFLKYHNNEFKKRENETVV